MLSYFCINSYVKKHIREIYLPRDGYVLNKDRLHQFVACYLRQDGVFLLRLIGSNINKITVDEITEELWKDWNNRKDKEYAKRTEPTTSNSLSNTST